MDQVCIYEKALHLSVGSPPPTTSSPARSVLSCDGDGDVDIDMKLTTTMLMIPPPRPEVQIVLSCEQGDALNDALLQGDQKQL